MTTPPWNEKIPAYTTYDRAPIPGDIPELGVKEGDEGVIESLDLRNNNVFASVRVYRSTGQTRGMVEMQVRPRQEVVSYATL